ncbi:MAG: LytTR family DNA-binding domain-containing protein [Lacrimispora sp.]|uniref:response regulator transcription factor n=1 Tax=Lacrimispora sp. TaxID=2719234 RepID=UPI0039E2A510
MYEVALCEDENIFFEAQKKICRNIFDRLNIEYHISGFRNSSDFLKAFMEQGNRYDLLLLDILMDGADGMALARKIRESDRDATIIFITSSPDFALQGYDVGALHYLMKPLDGEKLEQLIHADYHSRFSNHFFLFETREGKQRAAIKDIICLETAGRRVEVTMREGPIYVSGKLTDLLNELPKEQFTRCHQAYVVNIQNIRELTKQDAIAVNGKEIPVSRTYMKDVQRAFVRQMRSN